MTGDLPDLARVALAAKAHWKYPPEWLEAWAEALTVTPAQLEDWHVLVAVAPETIGFGAVDARTDPGELEHLWILPGWMGRGLGAALFRQLAERAAGDGCRALETDADPNAVGFYETLGGIVIGRTPADVLGQARSLPRMRFAPLAAPMVNARD